MDVLCQITSLFSFVCYEQNMLIMYKLQKSLMKLKKDLPKLKWLYSINKEHLQTTKNCFKLAAM